MRFILNKPRRDIWRRGWSRKYRDITTDEAMLLSGLVNYGRIFILFYTPIHIDIM